jgi:hypothetical protein
MSIMKNLVKAWALHEAGNIHEVIEHEFIGSPFRKDGSFRSPLHGLLHSWMKGGLDVGIVITSPEKQGGCHCRHVKHSSVCEFPPSTSKGGRNAETD